MKIWSWAAAAGGLAIGLGVHFQPMASAALAQLGGPSETLLVAGHFDGMLEPCGCTAPMIGGVRRLGTLAAQLRAQGPTTIVITAGSVPNIATQSSLQAKQNVLKAETAALVAKSIGADALGLGSQEASYGLGMLSEVVQLFPDHVVNSQVTAPEGLPLRKFVSHGRFLIGAAGKGASSMAASFGGTSTDEVQAAKDLAFQAQTSGQIAVLMLDDTQVEAQQISTAVPGLGLILYSSQGSADPGSRQTSGPWLASPGSQGRDVLVFSLDANGLSGCRVQKLTPDLADAASVSDVMTDYLHRVGAANLLAQWPKVKTGTYVGPQACMSCHRDAYHTWTASKHALAYKTLEVQGHGLDPDCVRCHVTGLSSTSGFVSLAKTPQFAGVTCESCHGPGKAHSLNPRWVKMQDGRQACSYCHTPEHSPQFNFMTYWAKIKH